MDGWTGSDRENSIIYSMSYYGGEGYGGYLLLYIHGSNNNNNDK